MANAHDKRYKKLFSHPGIVKELLLYFVKEKFVAELDFSTLERMDKSFITDQFKEKESDVIFKICFKEQPIFIYLLIEFQSTIDKFMALRINRYIMEFYEYLAYNEKVKELPAVFPILLYNGSEKWTASSEIRELIQPSIPDKYIPHLSYYKIIENEIPKQVLLQIENAVAAIFFIENSNPDELKQEFNKIIKLLEKEQPEIIFLFRRWLNNLFDTAKEEWDNREFNEQIDDILEVKVMFETALKERDERTLQQGMQQGMQQGKKETAKKMLEHGVSIQVIMECTELSEEEIQGLGE